MNLNSKQSVGVPIYTRSGRMLGKLASLDFDAATGHLVSLRVSSGLMKDLLSSELSISWKEVIEVTAEKIIVADAVVPEGSSVAAIA
jgi:uncharacterized protein YrrD